MTLRRAAVLTAAYYAVAFATFGAYLPYWPVWLEAWGLDRAAIGYFLGFATLSRIAGSLFLSGLADRLAVRRKVVAGASVLSAAGLVAHVFIADDGLLLAATLLLAFSMAPQVPIGEALGLRAAAEFKFGYAVVRAAGSVGFLIANIGVGRVLDQSGPALLPWVCAAGFLAVAAFGSIHPGGGGPARDRTAKRGEWLDLLRDRRMRWFLGAAALCQASHVIFYVYGTLGWRDQGLSGETIGWLWAFGVIVETLVLLGPGQRLIAWLGPALAIALGGLAGTFRWLAMSWAPALAWLWPLQAMHALTFALAHLGAMAFLARHVPDRLGGTAQGVLSATTAGLSSLLAAVAGASVIAWYGIGGGYALAALISAMSVASALVLARTAPR